MTTVSTIPNIDINAMEQQIQARDSKRRRLAEEKSKPYDFVITIAPQTLYTLVSTLKNLLNRVTINVVKKETGFRGISCDSASPGMTCMVKSRLACTVDINPALNDGIRTEFIVHVAEFADVIKECLNKGTQTIEILRYQGSDKLTIDCPNAVPRDVMHLRTLMQHPEDNRLEKLKVYLQIQIGLHELKSFCASCVKFKAETVSIAIKEKSVPNSDQKSTYIVLGFQSDSLSRSMRFPTTIDTNQQGLSQAVCEHQDRVSVGDLEDYSVVYQENFAVEFLNQFFKSIDRNNIWMNLIQNGPMIMHYSLGNETSYMRLIVAPKSEEE